MATVRIYQGETFTFAVSSEVTGAMLDIVLYKNDSEAYKYEDVDTSFTIPASETALMEAGTYTLEAKAAYNSRLYTAIKNEAIEVVSAESRDLLLDEESATDTDAGIEIHVSISDANLNLALNKNESGGDVEALTLRVAALETAMPTKATKTELTAYAKTADVATTYATKTELASKADTSALSAYATTASVTSTLTAYAKTADVATTYATKTEVNGKANTPTTASDIPAISELTRDTFVDLGELSQNMIVTVTNSLYELNVAFSCGDEAYSVTFSGGYQIGEYTIEANKSYLMSICNSNVVVVERVENE